MLKRRVKDRSSKTPETADTLPFPLSVRRNVDMLLGGVPCPLLRQFAQHPLDFGQTALEDQVAVVRLALGDLVHDGR